MFLRLKSLLGAGVLALLCVAAFGPEAQAQTLSETLAGLRRISNQPLIGGWKMRAGEVRGAQAVRIDERGWTPARPDSKGNIYWPKGRQVLWLRQRIVVPATWNGYQSARTRLRLNLVWWAEQVDIYVNGRYVQSGDLYDASQRVPLTLQARPGESFEVALRLVSPGHDRGALTEAHLDVEAPPGTTDPGLFADELEVVDGYLRETASASERQELTPALESALATVDWQALGRGDQATFDQSLAVARAGLAPVAVLTRQQSIALLGHSHIDMAWLWPVPETHRQIEKTFRSTLGLMNDFGLLNFAQSSAQAYAWMEREQPQLFKQIQKQVKAGRWEPVGGMWVEPDLNLPDGESLVRQVLYGKRYFLSRFGKDIRIGWNPDSFGYTWQLPQIYKKSGIDFFLTQKLEWNDTTKFPHRIFWWQAPDGSKILTYFAPPLGEQINGLKMAEKARAYEKNSGVPRLLWLYGVGDHGGGPTRDMLETAGRWQASPVYPRVEPTTALDYFQELLATDRRRPFPTWNSELYLEFHRGTYTTHAEQKRANREAEVLLANLEKFSTVGSLLAGTPYPKPQLEGWWKSTLFNQFHDILPGSAITPVYTQANQERQAVAQGGRALLDAALGGLARRADTRGEGLPVVVFNSLAGDRTGPVQLVAEGAGDALRLEAVDREGRTTPVQRTADGELVFWAEGVPGLGHKVFWIRQAREEAPAMAGLENESVRAVIDAESGNLTSLYDKLAGREMLAGPGNQLQFFKDDGQYWDAWNIDPDYEKFPLPPASVVAIEPRESGPVRAVLRITRRFRASTFVQDLVLYRRSPQLLVDNRVDWQERHVLVKAAFPLALRTEGATYEIPFGAIDRSLKRDTPARRAQWEVPALRWASLSDGRAGVTLVNDGKYGHDASQIAGGSLLRLSLLRGPQWPDPQADLGAHRFRYALYPHPGNWREGEAVARGLDLNVPLLPVVETAHPGDLPERFLSIDSSQVVLATWKRAEDGDGWIVRLYESTGRPVATRVRFFKKPTAAALASLMEGSERSLSLEGAELPVRLGPYEIQTLKVKF